MPEKNSTVVAYAAGASLAAASLFYIFGPTFFIDGENSYNTSDGRKRTIIGLSNPANDCFINSVLQALAGLGDLRLYIIRELHRRRLEDAEIYTNVPSILKRGEKPEKIVNLQQAPVTKALKDMLDALNERPIYKKTITAKPLIEALERAFHTRISRNQQDAQEFLQILLERLCDEYHASEKARKRFGDQPLSLENGQLQTEVGAEGLESGIANDQIRVSGNEGFPFEGRIESQIQCQYCGFRTKPSATTFVSLTLNVPQKSSTTLDNCFDILLKSEEIEDFKCDKCRLKHALDWKNGQLRSAKADQEKVGLENDIELIETAIRDDPETPPKNVVLPESSQAPKRKIRKSTRITVFPKVIAIHLSRSVFDPNNYSSKNMAKVSYTHRLRLGGILNERWYKLLGIVCHKGSHNSGHYESFRRNHLYPPFATPDTFSAYATASRSGTPVPSAEPSPHIAAAGVTRDTPLPSRSTTSLSSASEWTDPSRPVSQTTNGTCQRSSVATGIERPASVQFPVQRTQTGLSMPQIKTQESVARFKRHKKSNDRWWRISDDKIKEARTSDVLGMQREVYLLFYELERPGDDSSA